MTGASDSAVCERTLGGRFVLRSLLGSGNFGDVYRAYDRDEGRELALKVLHKGDPDSLARFKAEFRAVAEVHDRNLVRLYELHQDEGCWFFTMELIEGFDLREWVRPGGVLDEDRLRVAMRGVAHGLAALHQTRHVHRDVKPSNVRISETGRVVLLDFGLAARLDDRAPGNALIGTPNYIAPELTEGGEPTPASDWYSLGVVLFELVADRLPFEGRAIEVLVQKRKREAPRLEEGDAFRSACSHLAAGLLARRPADRPGAASVVRAFGGSHAPPRRGVFVGRERELAKLQQAFEAGPSICWLEGEPGAGKSGLLREFLAGLSAEVLVLEGRCFERESVPYKGLDAAVDRLAHRLAAWPSDEVETVLPPGLPSLVTLFPVLGRVPLIARRGAQEVGYERAQLRVEAFEALRQLLGAVAQRRPVVLALDDLQWSDPDGVALLGALLRAPAPNLLFVGAFRSGASISLIRDLGGETLHVPPISERDAERLAASLLSEPNEARAQAIARASTGNVLLVELLARFGTGEDGVAGAVARSMASLEAPTRHLLEVICLAGQPLSRRIAESIAEASVDPLRGQCLVRNEGSDRVEAYHDRIREAVVRRLAEERRVQLHARLADELASAEADAETIAHHYAQCGRREEAYRWTLAAARRAETALAWERAARLYQQAIDGAHELGAPDADLWVALGDALGHSGRGAEADRAYRKALPAARSGQSRHAPVDLLRRSAEHLLRIGRMDDGMAALDESLRLVGMRLPKTPQAAVAVLLFERTRLRLRGLSFEERSEATADADSLAAVDLCFGAGVGLSSMDSLRGAGLLARSLRYALDAGEPYRIARSMAYEASFNANRGAAGEARATELVLRTEAIAERLDSAHLRALGSGARCLIAFHNGRWPQAVRWSKEAEALFRQGSVGMVKEISTVQLLGSVAQLFLGHLDALEGDYERRMQGAVQRGDLFSQANLRTGFLNALWLAKDDVARARTEAESALRDWDPGYYVLQRFFDLWARTQIELYAGDAAAAGARLRAGYPAFERSLLTRLPFLRACGWDLAGRVALAEASQLGRTRALARARRCAARLCGEHAPWAMALGLSLEAGVFHLRGDRSRAEDRLADAMVRFEEAKMRTHVAAVQCARDDAEGKKTLRGCGVANPSRWTHMLLPAFAS
ncbi:MAG: protein kinase [Myxococcota bacterium]